MATFAVAFFELDLLGTSRWVGLENFRDLARGPGLPRGARQLADFAAFAVPLRLLGGVGLALLLHERFRGVGAARTSAYLPTVVPDIAYALLWLFLLNPLFGPINARARRRRAARALVADRPGRARWRRSC